MKYFNQAFLDFFIQLSANNNKEWFDLHRTVYENEVKKKFQVFVKSIIDEIAVKETKFKDLEVKDCIFRINRDVRFSKDKTPYKTFVSAVVASEGKKTKAINGVYFELGPEHVRVYGGVYEIDKDDLYFVREGISKNLKKFQDLVKSNEFQSVYGGTILGEKNKLLPKEFQESAKKEALIFNKQWYFYKDFDASLVLSEKLKTEIIKCYHAGKPIQDFLNQFIG